MFGSRASWTARDSSDLDLALEGDSALDHGTIVALEAAFEESILPYKVDLIDIGQVSDSFRRIVRVQSVPLMEEHGSDSVSADKNWVLVSDVAAIIAGGTPGRSVEEYWHGKIPWATAKDVATASGRYLDSTQEFITTHGLESSAAKLVPKGTIVIASCGTVGALVQLGQDMAFSQTCYALIPKSMVRQDFLFYALKGALHRMRAPANGTTFDAIAHKTLSNCRIPLPHLSKQQAISHTLGTLDDKIVLNRQMNQVLEDMARMQFKSWFVDFDPVRAKMDGRWLPGVSLSGLPACIYNLFPSQLVNSEMGEIPDGWEVKSLRQYATLDPESWSSTNVPRGVEYVDLANAKSGAIISTRNYLWRHAPSRARRILRPGDTIVGTIRPENRSYALVGGPGLTGSTDFAVLRPLRPEYRELVYLASTAQHNIDHLTRMVDGAAYPAVRPEAVFDTGVAVPFVGKDMGLLRQFSSIVAPIVDKMLSAGMENDVLAAQRDTLLPKIMSGEIQAAHSDGVVVT